MSIARLITASADRYPPILFWFLMCILSSDVRCIHNCLIIRNIEYDRGSKRCLGLTFTSFCGKLKRNICIFLYAHRTNWLQQAIWVMPTWITDNGLRETLLELILLLKFNQTYILIRITRILYVSIYFFTFAPSYE